MSHQSWERLHRWQLHGRGLHCLPTEWSVSAAGREVNRLGPEGRQPAAEDRGSRRLLAQSWCATIQRYQGDSHLPTHGLRAHLPTHLPTHRSGRAGGNECIIVYVVWTAGGVLIQHPGERRCSQRGAAAAEAGGAYPADAAASAASAEESAAAQISGADTALR